MFKAYELCFLTGDCNCTSDVGSFATERRRLRGCYAAQQASLLWFFLVPNTQRFLSRVTLRSPCTLFHANPPVNLAVGTSVARLNVGQDGG